MKLAIAIFLALACYMATASDAVYGKICESARTDASKYWNGTGCIACPTGCLECVWKNNAVSCLNCGKDAKKFLSIVNDIGTCGNCVANCESCRGPAASDCIAPTSGYKVSPSGLFKCSAANCLYCSSDDKCAKCEYGFRLDASNGNCVACGEKCAECPDSPSTCKKCVHNMVLNNGTCTKCADGCKACPCTGCEAGYQYNNGTCIKCKDPNCASCNANTTVCDACRDRFGFHNGDKNSSCTPCGNSACTSCSADDSKCIACETGFGLNSNTCNKCPANCVSCDGTGTCTTCQTDHYLSSDKKACTKCPDYCKGCDSNGLCSACIAGFSLNADKKGCTACLADCATCTNATVCTACSAEAISNGTGSCLRAANTCKQGQTLDTNGTCHNGTINNCVYGYNKTSLSCSVCAKGYYADGQGCTPCPNGCDSCAVVNGYLECLKDNPVQAYFSRLTISTGKQDITGYSTGGVAKTTSDGVPIKCMPNYLMALPLQNKSNVQCNAYDNCPYPFHTGGVWACYIDGSGKSAVKVAVSLFALAVAAIFAL